MKETEIYNPKLNPLQKELVRELVNQSVDELWKDCNRSGASSQDIKNVRDRIKELKKELGL